MGSTRKQVSNLISIKLEKEPEISIPVEHVTILKDDLSPFVPKIVIGSVINPANNVFKDIVIIPFNLYSLRTLYSNPNASGFFGQFKELKENEKKRLQKKEDLLIGQLSTLTKDYSIHHSNAIRFSYIDGDAQINFYYLKPHDFFLLSQKPNYKIKPEPILRIVTDIYTLWFFVQKIKEFVKMNEGSYDLSNILELNNNQKEIGNGNGS